MTNKSGFLYRVFDLYYDGFRNMKLGRTLWAIIIVKLIIIFAVLKLFFFPNYLKQHAEEGKESEFVATQILKQ
jgi:flagellar basal body-associated protein FliL